MVGKEEEEVNMPSYRDRDAGWGWRPSDAASCRVGELSGLGLENPRAQGKIGGLGSAPRHLWPEGRGKEAALNLHSWRPQLSRGPSEPHPGLPSRTPGPGSLENCAHCGQWRRQSHSRPQAFRRQPGRAQRRRQAWGSWGAGKLVGVSFLSAGVCEEPKARLRELGVSLA